MPLAPGETRNEIPIDSPSGRESIDEDMLDQWTCYHAATSDQQERYRRINQAARVFLAAINRECQSCADKSHAMRLARDARMWANTAIALESAKAKVT